MNPVLMLVHNNLEATKRAVESVMRQVNCPGLKLIVMDNDSPDEIRLWLIANDISSPRYSPQVGVTRAWNIGLEACFEFFGCEHCLVVNNDVELPTWFYYSLREVRDGIHVPGLVSGVSVNVPVTLTQAPRLASFSPHPDFSAFLIRRFLWRELEGFDNRMMHYASDNDFHVRSHRAGHKLINAGYPFYHDRSSTLRTALPEERAILDMQADQDRQVFREKWGCGPWETEKYDTLFTQVVA